jgi:exodeoxyribonuclease VII small subunit
MASAKKPASETSGSFDQRLSRLEQIVAELETGKIALEPAIERYQEGVELLKSCRDLLDGFKKRVEELSADAEAGTVPYAGDPDAQAERGERARRDPRES